MSGSETPLIGPNARPPSRLRSIGSYPKKPRQQSTDNVCDTVDDARPKTRRVNPERLATRLDPRLVAEMDAFIVPGAKMPNFAIRKDFQERYCVDRRHIYDYFHSRGLRVAKEDKHNNLLKGRLLKARSRAVMAISDNEIAVKREEEKPPKLRLRSVAKTEDVKLPRRRIINCAAVTQMTELHPENSSLSPTSCNSEEQTSSTDSPEPEFTMTNGILDSFSISIRAYTDTDSLSPLLDNFYSSYSLSQNQCYENTSPSSSNALGVQEFSSLVEEYTPFVQREHLDYYDQCFFAQDGAIAPFVEGHRMHDKVAELHLATGSTHLNHVINGNGCFEAECGLSRRRDGTTTDLITRDDGDVDFSKWLLTVEAQDNSVVGQTESLLGGPRVTIQQSNSESDGGPSGPRTWPDVRCSMANDGTMQKIAWNVERTMVA